MSDGEVPLDAGLGSGGSEGIRPVEEVSCDNCVAACCKPTSSLILTEDEYRKHRHVMDVHIVAKPRNYAQWAKINVEVVNDDGTREVVPSDMPVPRWHGYFLFKSPCGNLDEHDRCSVYETRPGCCRTFEVGSEACLNLRKLAGL